MVTKLGRHDMLIFSTGLAYDLCWVAVFWSLSLGVCVALPFRHLVPNSITLILAEATRRRARPARHELWNSENWLYWNPLNNLAKQRTLDIDSTTSIGKHGWKYAPNCSDLLTTGCTCYQANRKELQELQDNKHCPLWVGPASFEQFQFVICIIILRATAHAHMRSRMNNWLWSCRSDCNPKQSHCHWNSKNVAIGGVMLMTRCPATHTPVPTPSGGNLGRSACRYSPHLHQHRLE